MRWLSPPPLPAAVAGETLQDVLAEVRAVALAGDRLITDNLAGGYRSAFRGSGVEFADVREYTEGDDPRQIDWNVTARVGRPFVKRFVEERERTLVFALDLGPGMQLGLGAWSLRQAASRFAACLINLAIDNHDRTGLIAGGGCSGGGRGVERFVLPKKGAGHALRILRDLVEMPLARTGGGLDALLAIAAARLRRRVVLFVLSDWAGDAPLPALLPCARRHDVVAVRFVAAEWTTPPAALLPTLGPATGERRAIAFAAPAVRAAIPAQLAAWRAARPNW
jgi:uncharacterized protein (DUF58 family)